MTRSSFNLRKLVKFLLSKGYSADLIVKALPVAKLTPISVTRALFELEVKVDDLYTGLVANRMSRFTAIHVLIFAGVDPCRVLPKFLDVIEAGTQYLGEEDGEIRSEWYGKDPKQLMELKTWKSRLKAFQKSLLEMRETALQGTHTYFEMTRKAVKDEEGESQASVAEAPGEADEDWRMKRRNEFERMWCVLGEWMDDLVDELSKLKEKWREREAEKVLERQEDAHIEKRKGNAQTLQEKRPKPLV